MAKRPASILSPEIKVLALLPLTAMIILGFLLYSVQHFLSASSQVIYISFAVSLLLIPAFTYMIGHRVLAHLLGSKIEEFDDYSHGVASGYPKKTLLPEADESTATSLCKLAARFEKISTSINSEVEQLSAASNEILFTSQMQAASINETKQVMQDMSQRIQVVSSLAHDTETISLKANSSSINGEAVIQDALHAMQQISDAMALAAEQIDSMTTHAHGIEMIAVAIREIAEQTNLLSLNAAIEAARAGEQGRGFGVVADEVKKLAARTAQSTQEITRTIQRMQTQTLEAVQGIGQAMPLMKEGVEKANLASKVLGDIREESKHTVEKITQLAGEMDEQSKMVSNVVDSVTQILDMTANTDKVAERILQTSVILSHTAIELQKESKLGGTEKGGESQTGENQPENSTR